MIRGIILIIDAILFIASLTIYLSMELMSKKQHERCMLARNYDDNEDRWFNNENLYISSVLCILVTMLFGIMLITIPTKYNTETFFKEQNVVALTDNRDTKIYGTLSGGFIYVNGEIKTETETILTIAITDSDGKVEFKNFNLADDRFSLYLTDYDYVLYEEIYERKYCHVELFGLTYDETVTEYLIKTKIYLPKSSLQYDNILDGK